MMKNTKVILFFSLLISFMSGCAVHQPDIYYWGGYEHLIYKMYKEPGSQTPVIQIAKLTTDIQKSESSGKPIAPGVYAHLGFMYAIEGDMGKAEEAFNKEKLLFPESAVLIDGMFARARQAAQK